MSFGEILLILIIALIVIGPKQLLQAATSIATLIYRLRKYFFDLKQDLYNKTGSNDLIDAKEQIINTVREIKSNLTKTTKTESYEFDTHLFNNYLDTETYQPELDFDRQPELFDELHYE